CKFHVVFIPKCRRRTLYQELRRHLGEVFRRLALQKESKVEEGHLMPDHVHMLLAIPPKYAVAQVVGFVKGKSAIHIARVWGGRKHQYVGQHFWARGYWVSTVGRDEAAVRAYIAEQEKEDQRLYQLEMFEGARRFERFIISSLRLCRRSLTADEANNRIRKVVFPSTALVLTNVGSANTGNYDVVVSNPYGSVTSSIVTLQLLLPPTISTQP